MDHLPANVNRTDCSFLRKCDVFYSTLVHSILAVHTETDPELFSNPTGPQQSTGSRLRLEFASTDDMAESMRSSTETESRQDRLSVRSAPMLGCDRKRLV